MFNKDNGFMAGHKVVKLVYYDWKVNGVWKGVQIDRRHDGRR